MIVAEISLLLRSVHSHWLLLLTIIWILHLDTNHL